MARLRVLHLQESWIFASGSSSLPLLAKFRNKEFFDVEFGATIACDPRRKSEIERSGQRIHVFHGDYSALARFLRSEGIDVLHITRAGFEMSETIRIARESHVPLITELNVFGLHRAGQERNDIDLNLMQSKTAVLRYLSYSGMGMDSFLRKGGVMYLPIDVEKFARLRLSESQQDRVRSQLDLDYDAPVICRIGRPDMHKWSFFSIYMLSLLVERNPNVRFLIIGGVPPEVMQMIRRRRLEKFFRFLPLINDEKLVEVISCVDVLAHSSHIGESFGATIAEAMAAKKPVVVNSTDWADNAQVELVDHGITGLIANTPRAYADSVLYLLKNKDVANKMGRSGYAKVVQTYSAPVVTSSVEKWYSQIADRSNTKPSKERTEFYKNIRFVPGTGEIRQWPLEYQQRLLDSGYDLGSVGKGMLRRAWMATNLFRGIRRVQIPHMLFATERFPSYLTAIT